MSTDRTYPSANHRTAAHHSTPTDIASAHPSSTDASSTHGWANAFRAVRSGCNVRTEQLSQ